MHWTCIRSSNGDHSLKDVGFRDNSEATHPMAIERRNEGIRFVPRAVARRKS